MKVKSFLILLQLLLLFTYVTAITEEYIARNDDGFHGAELVDSTSNELKISQINNSCSETSCTSLYIPNNMCNTLVAGPYVSPNPGRMNNKCGYCEVTHCNGVGDFTCNNGSGCIAQFCCTATTSRLEPSKAFMRFDIAKLSGKTISSGKLYFTPKKAESTSQLKLELLQDNKKPNTEFYNASVLGEIRSFSAVELPANKEMSIDVTEQLKTAVKNDDLYLPFRFKAEPEGKGLFEIYSSESAKKPYLEVNYNSFPQVELVSPNGNEIAKYALEIIFEFYDEDNTEKFYLDIYYSLSESGRFENVVIDDKLIDNSICENEDNLSSTANYCSYVWSLPDINEERVWIDIRITDELGASGSDSSNEPFSIIMDANSGFSKASPEKAAEFSFESDESYEEGKKLTNNNSGNSGGNKNSNDNYSNNTGSGHFSGAGDNKNNSNNGQSHSYAAEEGLYDYKEIKNEIGQTPQNNKIFELPDFELPKIISDIITPRELPYPLRSLKSYMPFGYLFLLLLFAIMIGLRRRKAQQLQLQVIKSEENTEVDEIE